MSEENIELQRLAAEAEQIDAEAAPQPLNEVGPAEQQFDAVAEARAIIQTAVMAAGQFWPWTQSIYTPHVVEQLAQAWGPVMAFYGWSAGEFLTHPLAGAALMTLPIAAQTYQGYKVEQAKHSKTGATIEQSPGAANDPTVLQREAES